MHRYQALIKRGQASRRQDQQKVVEDCGRVLRPRFTTEPRLRGDGHDQTLNSSGTAGTKLKPDI
jgi:hypothetical protein